MYPAKTVGRRVGKCAGQLYQLCAKQPIPNGAYIGINGPWDTYGVVLSSAKTENGQYLHQLRGIPHRPGEKVVHNF